MNDVSIAPAARRAKPLREITSVREMLASDAALKQLRAVAAHTLRPERMARVVATALRTTPLLAECDPMSLLGAMMTAASLGLEPNTPLGHAYLIPYRRKRAVEAQLILGYKGLIDLARRSGALRSIHADVVYSDDALWEFEYGSQQRLRHAPGPRAGEKRYAYAHATLQDGGEAFVALPWAQVLKIRDGSQAYQTALRYGRDDTPWTAHEDEMAAKTAIRALAKRLPLSIEMAEAMRLDDVRADYAAVVGQTSADDALISAEVVDNTEDGDVIVADAAPEPAKPTKNATTTPAAKEASPPPPSAQEITRLARTLESRLDLVFETANMEAALEAYMRANGDDLARLAALAPDAHAEIEVQISQIHDNILAEGGANG